MNDAQLKSFAMETFEVRYPENDWLRVITHGSMLNRAHGYRTGIHCKRFNFYLPTGPFTFSFNFILPLMVKLKLLL